MFCQCCKVIDRVNEMDCFSGESVPGKHPLAEQLEVRQEYRRARWIVYHAFRKECHQSAARGEEQLSVMALEFLYIGTELIVRPDRPKRNSS